MQKPLHRRKAPRRAFAMMGALAIAAGGLLGLATAAQADDVSATITNPRVTLGHDPEGTGTEVDQNTQITTTTTLTFHADWIVPGLSKDGDTFLVPVPEAFRINSSEPFALMDKEGKPLASCQYSTPDAAIACTIVGGPHADAKGNIWFAGWLEATEPGENPSWEVGGDPIVLPEPHTPPPGPYTPPFGTYKTETSASIVDGKARLRWAVRMWPGCEGPQPGTCVQEFTLSDQLVSTDSSRPHTLREGSFQLYRWDRAQNDDGTWATDSASDTGIPGSRVELASYDSATGDWTVSNADLDGEVFDEPQVSADGKSYTFHLKGASVPHQYELRYWSDADGAVSLDNELFENIVTVNGEPFEAEARPRVQGGGGADAGSYASFTASKKVTNETAAELPEEYTLTATQRQQSETITVPADGTAVNSPYFPVSGGDITICEELPDVDGVAWAPYIVTGEGVTGPDADGCYTLAPAGGQRIAITVDNRATPAIVPKVSVGDYTWIDTNRDGIQDDGEPALAGVELTLVGPDGEEVIDVDGNAVAPQTTDVDGKYLFEKLPALQSGSYTVRVTKVPEGYLPTPRIEAGSDRAVDSSEDEASSQLPLDTDGAEDLTLDFGYVTYMDQKSTTPSPETTSGLAATGGGVAPFAAGAALLVLGAAVLLARTRRRTGRGTEA